MAAVFTALLQEPIRNRPVPSGVFVWVNGTDTTGDQKKSVNETAIGPASGLFVIMLRGLIPPVEKSRHPHSILLGPNSKQS